ncbi:hypothetical protein [Thermocatellispora tengchongensis]|uniref:hypothetical protein n=1 Tax=Thermocatellispora tengchongensis TaxID=1073253 RepID=UPI003635CB48
MLGGERLQRGQGLGRAPAVEQRRRAASTASSRASSSRIASSRAISASANSA